MCEDGAGWCCLRCSCGVPDATVIYQYVVLCSVHVNQEGRNNVQNRVQVSDKWGELIYICIKICSLDLDLLNNGES